MSHNPYGGEGSGGVVKIMVCGYEWFPGVFP